MTIKELEFDAIGATGAARIKLIASHTADATPTDASIHYQVVKLGFGDDGASVSNVRFGNGLPVLSYWNGNTISLSNAMPVQLSLGGAVISSSNPVPMSSGTRVATNSSKTTNVSAPASTATTGSITLFTATTGEVQSRTIQNNTDRDWWVDTKGAGTGRAVGFKLQANGGSREFNGQTKIPTGLWTASPDTTLNAAGGTAVDGNFYVEELV